MPTAPPKLTATGEIDWVQYKLPCPEIESFSLEPAPHTLRTEMETGAARVRVISRARNDRVDVSFTFTRAEFAGFRELFETEGAGNAAFGAGWFKIPMFIGRVMPDGSVPDTTYERCRFIGQWKAAPAEKSGKYFRVTCKLEISN